MGEKKKQKKKTQQQQQKEMGDTFLNFSSKKIQNCKIKFLFFDQFDESHSFPSNCVYI